MGTPLAFPTAAGPMAFSRMPECRPYLPASMTARGEAQAVLRATSALQSGSQRAQLYDNLYSGKQRILFLEKGRRSWIDRRGGRATRQFPSTARLWRAGLTGVRSRPNCQACRRARYSSWFITRLGSWMTRKLRFMKLFISSGNGVHSLARSALPWASSLAKLS